MRVDRGNTDAMKKLMKDVAAYTDGIFSKLRKQKDMSRRALALTVTIQQAGTENM